MGEKLLVGLEGTLIGFGLVFLVLCILIFAVKLMQFSIEKIESKKLSKSVSLPEQTAQLSAPQSNEEDDKAVIAAITAAITVMLASESGQDTSNVKFKVRSIKQII